MFFDKNSLFYGASIGSGRLVCQEKRRNNIWLLGYSITCELVNDVRIGESGLLTNQECLKLRLLRLNKAKPLPFTPWIAFKSRCIILNRIIRIFVEVILRRWDLRIPGPDRSSALYTQKVRVE